MQPGIRTQTALFLFLMYLLAMPAFAQDAPGENTQSGLMPTDISERAAAAAAAAAVGARSGEEAARVIAVGTVPPAAVVGAAMAKWFVITTGSDTRFPTMPILTSPDGQW